MAKVEKPTIARIPAVQCMGVISAAIKDTRKMIDKATSMTLSQVVIAEQAFLQSRSFSMRLEAILLRTYSNNPRAVSCTFFKEP